MKNKILSHYAFKILIACICMKLGASTVINYAMGNFVTPIITELNCQVSQLTMYVGFTAITKALLYTKSVTMLSTKKIGIVMGSAFVVEMLGLALMSVYKSHYLFYISGILIGAADAFTGYVAIPMTINMWFQKKSATILGVIMAVGSAAGMIYNFLSAKLIMTFGWRKAYLFLAIIASIITIPIVFMLIKTPEEIGCEPYGAEHSEDNIKTTNTKSGLTKKQAFCTFSLYMAWLACIFYSYGNGVSGYIATYSTTELGQSIDFGALSGILLGLGTIAGSLILGYLNDKHGIISGLVWGTITITTGYLIMIKSISYPIYALPGSLIIGLGSSMYSVQSPLLALNIVGNKHYSQIWAVMMIANSLIGGGLFSSIGLFYDYSGSYKGAFYLGIITYVLSFILGLVSVMMSNKQKYVLH